MPSSAVCRVRAVAQRVCDKHLQHHVLFGCKSRERQRMASAQADVQADLKQFLELQRQFVDASNKLKQARGSLNGAGMLSRR